MYIDLSGNTAIVTGSTAGIGLAIAKALATSGAQVIVQGRSQAAVDWAISAITAEAPDATIAGFAGDLGLAEGCAALAAADPACEILANNIGINPAGPPTPNGRAFSRSTSFRACVCHGPICPAWGNKAGARAVLISSEEALNIPANMIQYGFTKTAVMSIARGLAKRRASATTGAALRVDGGVIDSL